jgi:hypothetical protein
MMNVKISFLYRTTYLPTRATFLGIHTTADLNFGTSLSIDPYIGSGYKIKDLIAHIKTVRPKITNTSIRTLFSVETLLVGTLSDCAKKYKQLSAGFDYDNPLCLNVRPAGPTDPKSDEHKAAIGASLSVAMIGNENAVGSPNGIITPVKGKWYNDGTNELLLEIADDGAPVNSDYRLWTKGKLKDKTYANKRIGEIKETASKSTS